RRLLRRAMPYKNGNPSRIREAQQFLQRILPPEGMPQVEVVALATSAGISKRTLDRAKADLAIPSEQRGFHGRKYWMPAPSRSKGQHVKTPLTGGTDCQ